MPKFLGMEPKTLLWVGGGLAVLIVVYYVIKSRGGGGGAAAGGDLTGLGGGIGGSSPVSYAPGAPDTAGDAYAKQLNDLDIQARQEALNEQRAMFQLQQEEGKQQLGLWGAQQNLLFEGAKKEQEFQLGYEKSQYETAQAAQDVVTRSVKGKKKVECPVGQHLVVLADGTPQCQQKGGGSGPGEWISQVGQVLTGLLSGGVAAAPGIGYAAAQYGAAQAGVIGQQPGQFQQRSQQRTAYYTPPIVSRFAPYERQGTGVDKSIDYGTQHFNVPGSVFG